jgi:hypothetical protein
LADRISARLSPATAKRQVCGWRCGARPVSSSTLRVSGWERGSGEAALAEFFVRGARLSGVQLNPQNPAGTIQSIERALRTLDKNVANESDNAGWYKKMLDIIRSSGVKQFEYEARMKEFAGGSRLNAPGRAALDSLNYTYLSSSIKERMLP